MADLQYEDKLNAFFKTFEIPSLWNIHLLQTSTAKWQPLAKPANIAKKSSDLLFYSSTTDNRDYIIIITKRGIDRFDLQDNTSTHLTDFPDNLKCKGCEVAINGNNGDLYLIGGASKCFAIYNTETNEWDIKCLNKDVDRAKSNAYSISSVDNLPKIIDNTLYVSGWDSNRWYNSEHDTFIDISQENTSVSTATPSTNKETKIIYNRSLNKYIHFGSDSSYLFSSNLSNEIWFFGKHENNECLWYLSGIGLPSIYKRMTLKFVLSFESIIILIYFAKDDALSNDNMLDLQNEVWCLDLQTNEWFKGKANLDVIEDEDKDNDANNKNNNFDQYKLCITYDGEIHLLKLHGENTMHLFMHLCDILDDKLYQRYAQKYDCLVKGFVKNIAKEINQAIDYSFLPLMLSCYTIFK